MGTRTRHGRRVPAARHQHRQPGCIPCHCDHEVGHATEQLLAIIQNQQQLLVAEEHRQPAAAASPETGHSPTPRQPPPAPHPRHSDPQFAQPHPIGEPGSTAEPTRNARRRPSTPPSRPATRSARWITAERVPRIRPHATRTPRVVRQFEPTVQRTQRGEVRRNSGRTSRNTRIGCVRSRSRCSPHPNKLSPWRHGSRTRPPPSPTPAPDHHDPPPSAGATVQGWFTFRPSPRNPPHPHGAPPSAIAPSSPASSLATMPNANCNPARPHHSLTRTPRTSRRPHGRSPHRGPTRPPPARSHRGHQRRLHRRRRSSHRRVEPSKSVNMSDRPRGQLGHVISSPPQAAK